MHSHIYMNNFTAQATVVTFTAKLSRLADSSPFNYYKNDIMHT